MGGRDLKNSRSFGRSLKAFLGSTGFLTNGLFVIGGMILMGGFAIVSRVATPDMQDRSLAMVMLISFPWLIASCVFVILRKELPRLGLPSIRGKWAVVQGVVILSLLIYGEIYVIYLFLRSLQAP